MVLVADLVTTELWTAEAVAALARKYLFTYLAHDFTAMQSREWPS